MNVKQEADGVNLYNSGGDTPLVFGKDLSTSKSTTSKVVLSEHLLSVKHC